TRLHRVLPRKHQPDTGMFARGDDIDRHDARVRAIGAHKETMQLPRESPVGRELSASGEQPKILEARDLCALHAKGTGHGDYRIRPPRPAAPCSAATSAVTPAFDRPPT